MSEPSTKPRNRDRWVGRTLDGAFRIDELIGEGAMGRVYRCEQLSLGKPIAIKLLHDHLGGDKRIAKRFHREARAASRLSHPNSLTIIDFGEARDGTLFIAMELLEGEDLQTLIDHDAPLSPRRIGALMSQTLSALGEAHRAGIIHRDLKPENVVVSRTADGMERVKVCDFGIAKIMESEGRTTAITKDGYVCGTPEYMAPEQAKGDPLDMRADVYAAGVMLYQLLCGRVPFKAETALGLITKHIMDTPPRPRRVQPTWGIPRSLEQVALKALEKRPEDRYDDAASMSRAIEEAVDALGADADARLGHGPFETDGSEVEGEGEPAAVPEATGAPGTTAETIARVVPRGGALGWALALFASLCLLGVGVWLWSRPERPAAAPPTASREPTAIPSPEPRADEPVRELGAREDEDDGDTPSAPEPTPEVRDQPPAPAATPSPANTRPRLDPSPPPDPGRAAFEQGRAHLLRGELAAAIERLSEAARLRPSDPSVQRELGRAHVRAGDVARGVGAYRRYLELAPDASDRAVIERIIAQHER